MTKIYLYRRIGNQEWATCDESRFIELSSHKLFATKICYEEPAAPVPQRQELMTNYKMYTTQPAESLAGMAARQLDDSARWVEIRDANALEFPDMAPHDYYPVGSVIRIPAPLSPDHSGGVAGVVVSPPSNCRQRLAAEGKPYPRSSCAVCGQFSPKWRECDAALGKVKELNQ